MPETPLIVLTTLPDPASAEAMAEHLLEQNLAACVNISSEITSIYRWNNKLHKGIEHQVVIKTTQACYPRLQAWIAENHPYELPEILAIPVAEGLPDYLNWIEACTKS